MSTRATHRGTCQLCGHLQKLPGGELAKHGYTKQWGFFAGTCPGSHWLPFELSCARIQGAITDTRQAIGRLEAEVAALNARPIESPASSAPYMDRRNGGAREIQVAVYQDEHGVVRLVFPDGRGVRAPIGRPALTVESVVLSLRANKCARIADAIKQREDYIAWLEARLRDWQPNPGALVPVESEEVTSHGR